MSFHRFVHVARKDVIIDVERTAHGLAIAPNASSYKGVCEWLSFGETLDIHTLDAQPDGQGLGTVLMCATALEGFSSGLSIVNTQATAQSALTFYLKMGLRPLNPFGDKVSYDLTNRGERDAFDLRVLGTRHAAVWLVGSHI